MYLRITTRCNMSCGHCAFACTNRGSDMTLETFKAALELAENRGDSITLGGGEPTIHPQFWEFFGLALAKFNSEPGMFIVTNGKQTETALALAALAKGGILGVALSQDEYHDRIDGEVIQAFTRDKYAHTMYGYVHREGAAARDAREIRTPNRIINAGRAKTNGIGQIEECFCDDIVVEPTGRLWMCGCRRRPFGTVLAPEIPDDYYESETRCSTDDARAEALAA